MLCEQYQFVRFIEVPLIKFMNNNKLLHRYTIQQEYLPGCKKGTEATLRVSDAVFLAQPT